MATMGTGWVGGEGSETIFSTVRRAMSSARLRVDLRNGAEVVAKSFRARD